MKKLAIAFITLSTFFSGSLIAQDLNYGFRLGTQITNFNGEDADNVERDARVAFTVGGFINRKVNNFVFQTELLYSVKGINVEDRNDRLRLTYVELPIVAKYYFHEKFNVHLGPQVGFLIQAEYGGDKVTDQFNSLDLGAIAGFEYDHKQDFLVGVRYNLGFISVADKFVPYNDGRVLTDLSNRAFQVYLAFRLGGNNNEQIPE